MRPKLSVIIPTLTGREESLGRIERAYLATGPWSMEIVVVKDKASWPTACNAGYLKARGDVLHFGADDLEPLPGWHEEVLPWLEENDELPAAKVLNHSADGEWDNRGDGADRELTHFTRVPILTREQYVRIGRWPEYNYVADVWLSEKGRSLGIQTRIFHSYAFVHHWAQEGRQDGPEVLAEAARVLDELRREF